MTYSSDETDSDSDDSPPATTTAVIGGGMKGRLNMGYSRMPLGNSRSKSKLLLAVERGDLEIVTNLLDKGEFSVDDRNKAAATPLMISSIQGNVDMCRLLLDKGADPNAFTEHNFTPLMVAIDLGPDDPAVPRLLLERGAKLSEEGAIISLISAVVHSKIKLCELLLEEKLVSPNVRGPENATPLILSSGIGSEEVAALLLKHGADPNMQSDEGHTALMTVSDSEIENESFVNLLLNANADVNIVNKIGMTALHSASSRGHINIVKRLLENKSDPNIGTNEATPLLLTISNNHLEIAKILLDAGANPNVKNKEGWTPLHFAADKGENDLVEKIMKNNGSFKVDVDAREDNSMTPLIVAACKGQLDTVKLLHSYKADINATDKDGRTALHNAVGYSHPELVSALLKMEADYCIHDLAEDMTPLAIAKKYSPELMRLFEKHEAYLLTLRKMKR